MSEIRYVLMRSSRRKTVAIKVEPFTGKVVVSAPQNMPLERINNIVKSKSAWINKHLNNVESRNAILPEIKSGSQIYIAGKNYILNVCKTKRAMAIEGYIDLPEENAKKALSDIAKKLFLPYVKRRTQILADSLGFEYASVSVGNARKKWGSCFSDNRIVYSVALSFVPEEVCDYVIIHELCHTCEKNHQKGFYTLLKRCLPDYKAREAQLKAHSSFLYFLA